MSTLFNQLVHTMNRGLYIIVSAGIVVFFIFDTWNDRYRLVSLAGLVIIIGFMFLFSNNPAKV